MSLSWIFDDEEVITAEEDGVPAGATADHHRASDAGHPVLVGECLLGRISPVFDIGINAPS